MFRLADATTLIIFPAGAILDGRLIRETAETAYSADAQTQIDGLFRAAMDQ